MTRTPPIHRQDSSDVVVGGRGGKLSDGMPDPRIRDIRYGSTAQVGKCGVVETMLPLERAAAGAKGGVRAVAALASNS